VAFLLIPTRPSECFRAFFFTALPHNFIHPFEANLEGYADVGPLSPLYPFMTFVVPSRSHPPEPDLSFVSNNLPLHLLSLGKSPPRVFSVFATDVSPSKTNTCAPPLGSVSTRKLLYNFSFFLPLFVVVFPFPGFSLSSQWLFAGPRFSCHVFSPPSSRLSRPLNFMRRPPENGASALEELFSPLFSNLRPPPFLSRAPSTGQTEQLDQDQDSSRFP